MFAKIHVMKLPGRLLDKRGLPVWSVLAAAVLVGGCASGPEPKFTSEPPPQPDAAAPASGTQPAAAPEAGQTNGNSGADQPDAAVRFQIGDKLIVQLSGLETQIL